MNSIKFRIAAKTDVGLVRENNEDNFQASSDLSVEPMRWVNNEICSLGEKGALLVVADGMGGMNAGEVASELAIETVRTAFSPKNLTHEVMKSRFSIEKFMNSVIVEADMRIKSEAKSHPESRGMGTTIVIGWLLDGKLYVSWCGDSRAYVYNPKAGLHQISKDHSYVQSLVDKGAISKEDAFDYPESNIITRCLSDSPTKAKPESLLQPYDVSDNDIIMLCTDGLSGMIRDHEIEAVIRNHEHDMDACSVSLIQAACDAEGADNITICLCQILQGAGACNPEVFDVFDKRLAGPEEKSSKISDLISTKVNDGDNTKRKKLWFWSATLLLLLAVTFAVLYFTGAFPKKKSQSQTETQKTEQPTRRVPTQRIVATDGRYFDLERKEGDPQIGDKAYPDGSYDLDGKRTVVIEGGKVDTIIEKDQSEEEPSLGSGSKKNTDNNINNALDGVGPLPSKNPIHQSKDSKVEAKNNELTPADNGSEINTIHTVQPGETLSSIGEFYGITVDRIKELNPSIKGDQINAGDKLTIKYIKNSKHE